MCPDVTTFFQVHICLVDCYPEEVLRLLTCRHVFHKDCVDRWLETGRNNCPACRSQVRKPVAWGASCLLRPFSLGCVHQPWANPHSFLGLICGSTRTDKKKRSSSSGGLTGSLRSFLPFSLFLLFRLGIDSESPK